MEYAGGGDLLQYIQRKKVLTEDEARKIFRQIIDAVKACHSKNIVHRDIKLDNILISSDHSQVKLCDFGISRMIMPGKLAYEECGTPAYLAPEII